MNTAPFTGRWVEREMHRHWLAAEGLDLLEFDRAACLAGAASGRST